MSPPCRPLLLSHSDTKVFFKGIYFIASWQSWHHNWPESFHLRFLKFPRCNVCQLDKMITHLPPFSTFPFAKAIDWVTVWLSEREQPLSFCLNGPGTRYRCKRVLLFEKGVPSPLFHIRECCSTIRKVKHSNDTLGLVLLFDFYAHRRFYSFFPLSVTDSFFWLRNVSVRYQSVVLSLSESGSRLLLALLMILISVILINLQLLRAWMSCTF